MTLRMPISRVLRSVVNAANPYKPKQAIMMANAENTENIYKSLAIISSRARQLAVDIKLELHGKLEEFAVTSETIEEIQENKEQIEISKFYEKLPNPTIIATEEFFAGKLDYRSRDTKED